MVILGSTVLGQAAPCAEAIASARSAAYVIYGIIDQVSRFIQLVASNCGAIFEHVSFWSANSSLQCKTLHIFPVYFKVRS